MTGKRPRLNNRLPQCNKVMRLQRRRLGQYKAPEPQLSQNMINVINWGTS